MRFSTPNHSIYFGWDKRYCIALLTNSLTKVGTGYGLSQCVLASLSRRLERLKGAILLSAKPREHLMIVPSLPLALANFKRIVPFCSLILRVQDNNAP